MTDAADKEAFERVYLGGNQLLARRNSTDGNYVLPSINDAWCGFHSALEYARQVSLTAENVSERDKAFQKAVVSPREDKYLTPAQQYRIFEAGIEWGLARQVPPASVDVDAMRLDWLERQDAALLSDDNGHWSVSFEGMQSCPLQDEPQDIWTSFVVKAEDWYPSVREAIDAALSKDTP